VQAFATGDGVGAGGRRECDRVALVRPELEQFKGFDAGVAAVAGVVLLAGVVAPSGSWASHRGTLGDPMRLCRRSLQVAKVNSNPRQKRNLRRGQGPLISSVELIWRDRRNKTIRDLRGFSADVSHHLINVQRAVTKLIDLFVGKDDPLRIHPDLSTHALK
jgi:hypothetical protein